MAVIERFSELYKDLIDFEVSELSSIYATNIEFVDPVTTHKGLNSVTKYFENLLTAAQQCDFHISNVITCNSNNDNIDYVVTWTMVLVLKGQSKTIKLEGITQLKVENDLIVYHRDYYDIGQMVYEHIPILGWAVKKIKNRLAS